MIDKFEVSKKDLNNILNNMLLNKSYSKSIFSECGDFQIDGSKIEKGIGCFKWNMEFYKDIELKRVSKSQEEDIQFIFFIDRDLSWYIKDRKETVQMKKGQVCLYKDDFYSTSCFYNGSKKYTFKSIQISNKYFNNILDSYENEIKNISNIKEKISKEVSKFNISSKVYHILSEIDEADKYSGVIKNIYLEGKILEIVAIYLQEILETSKEKVNRNVLRNNEDIEALKKAKEIIDNTIADTPSCQELAKSINMSISKFTKSFMKMYGTTVHKYVIEKRLENAAVLLSKEDINISEAAILSGYNNMSHFSDSFKKKYGVLPREFRN
ncbi:MAG: helix-turn-helix domain-containing protein [Clostridium butyricum]|nr:helix-turn-helix domain-containing protein [Clostridium butyricum]